MEEKAISVTQISTYFKQIFDAEELLQNISVFGEVSDFSLSRGVAYFSLKDENALLSCVCFGADNLVSVRNGDKVIVRGTPKYYVKGGKLNFNVNKIAPFGTGNLFEQFLKLKQDLENEGLFDDKNKKTISPQNIKRIGVVTSETGAVIQDIINVVTRRNPFVDIVLYPVKVQGYNAELDIVKGINFFSDYPNVNAIIVARGGGSLEDLKPFNSEIVARAVFACTKPLISAVGHETDFTIIDFVSDLRAPTPSVAAELITENVAYKKQNLIDKDSCFHRNIQTRPPVSLNLLHKETSDEQIRRNRADGQHQSHSRLIGNHLQAILDTHLHRASRCVEERSVRQMINHRTSYIHHRSTPDSRHARGQDSLRE